MTVPAAAERRRDIARLLLVLAAIGSFCSPPIANVGEGLGLIAFFSSPGAWIRLRAAAARPLGIGLLVLLSTMALAMLWADVEWHRRLGAWWSWRPLLVMLVASSLFDDARWKDRFSLLLVGALAVAAVASFLVLLLPDPVLIDQPGVILRNHTTQGMAFVVGTVLAGMLAWGRPVPARTRLMLIAAMILFIANIALVAAGRSGHVALIVAATLGGVALVRDRRRWLLLFIIPAAGIAILASSSMVRQRFEAALSEMDAAVATAGETPMGIRKVVWETTRELISRRPLLGYGVGGFAPAYAQLIHERYTGWQAQEAKDTHNQYLRVMVEAGIPGALALLAFIVGVFRQTAPAPFRGAALALFAAWLVTSLFNSHFQTFSEAHLIALVLGVLLAGGNGAQAPASAVQTAAATSS